MNESKDCESAYTFCSARSLWRPRARTITALSSNAAGLCHELMTRSQELAGFGQTTMVEIALKIAAANPKSAPAAVGVLRRGGGRPSPAALEVLLTPGADGKSPWWALALFSRMPVLPGVPCQAATWPSLNHLLRRMPVLPGVPCHTADPNPPLCAFVSLSFLTNAAWHPVPSGQIHSAEHKFPSPQSRAGSSCSRRTLPPH